MNRSFSAEEKKGGICYPHIWNPGGEKEQDLVTQLRVQYSDSLMWNGRHIENESGSGDVLRGSNFILVTWEGNEGLKYVNDDQVHVLDILLCLLYGNISIYQKIYRLTRQITVTYGLSFTCRHTFFATSLESEGQI